MKNHIDVARSARALMAIAHDGAADWWIIVVGGDATANARRRVAIIQTKIVRVWRAEVVANLVAEHHDVPIL